MQADLFVILSITNTVFLYICEILIEGRFKQFEFDLK